MEEKLKKLIGQLEVKIEELETKGLESNRDFHKHHCFGQADGMRYAVGQLEHYILSNTSTIKPNT
jgi:hypothetical protein